MTSTFDLDISQKVGLGNLTKKESFNSSFNFTNFGEKLNFNQEYLRLDFSQSSSEIEYSQSKSEVECSKLNSGDDQSNCSEEIDLVNYQLKRLQTEVFELMEIKKQQEFELDKLQKFVYQNYNVSVPDATTSSSEESIMELTQERNYYKSRYSFKVVHF